MQAQAARFLCMNCCALLVACAASDLGKTAGVAAPSGSIPSAGHPSLADAHARDRKPLAFQPRVRPPRLPVMAREDLNADRIQDALEAESRAATDSRVDVEVLFTRAATPEDVATFERMGGQVRHIYRSVAYGFTGTLPANGLADAARALGPDLLTIAGGERLSAHLDQATRNARVRPVWASGFGGSSSGYVGDDTIAIAIVDTGVDASHTDLTGRLHYFHDYTTDAEPSAIDVAGHGTFVAGIAVGSGASAGSGAGLVHYTQSGDETALVGSGEIFAGYFGSGTSLVSLDAKWYGGGSASLMWLQGTYGAGVGTFTPLGMPVTGSSPLSWSNTIGFGDHKFSAYLQSPSSGAVTHYAISVSLANYPASPDGAPILSGVCPHCGYAGLKVFSNDFAGSSLALAEALDDVVAIAESDSIKIVNMSVGTSGTNATLLAKIDTAVQNGLFVAIAEGNGGTSTHVAGMARASLAMTVGATNDDNALTEYTTLGNAGDATLPMKPDILAPGGSVYGSSILSLDTNSGEAGDLTLTDLVANDYTLSHGTSAATPVVAGAAALIIDALQQHGTTWDFSSSDSPLLVKAVLCATATETAVSREGGPTMAPNDPVLGRAASPKDIAEGYGILNTDAAIEAVTVPWTGTLSASMDGTRFDRRAYARLVVLEAGSTFDVTLTMDSSLDVDLYLYREQPDARGEPMLLASSSAGSGSEQLSYTSDGPERTWLVVKRVSGMGAFSASSTLRVCGNGVLEAGEGCDDHNRTDGDCCSATCTLDADASACSIDPCQVGQTCSSGQCMGGAPRVCTALDACHIAGSCNPGTGVCSNPNAPDGHACDDADACTRHDACAAGHCVGSDPVACSAVAQCEQNECDPQSGMCIQSHRTNGTECDDSDACTVHDACEDGVCTGEALACPVADACHGVGVCDPATALCNYAPLAEGTSCDDGDACTQHDRCQLGACAGDVVTCAAADTCSAGACDPGTGACVFTAREDGAACDDGNGCTVGDHCAAGTCSPGSPLECAPSDACHLAGTCDPQSGMCSNPERPGANGDCSQTGPSAHTERSGGSAAAPSHSGCNALDESAAWPSALAFMLLLPALRPRRRRAR